MTEGNFTRIYLVRHGQTPRKGYCNGHLDVELTAQGIAEMEAAAARLGSEEISALYASDLKRAVQGAEIFGRILGLNPVIDRSLREKCFGKWEGVTETELQSTFPAEWHDWLANPADAKPSGGESCREMAARVLPTIAEIIKRHWRERVAIVAHGGVNRVILCHALNLDLRHMERFSQRHAALNIIDFYEDRGFVQLMNG